MRKMADTDLSAEGTNLQEGLACALSETED